MNGKIAIEFSVGRRRHHGPWIDEEKERRAVLSQLSNALNASPSLRRATPEQNERPRSALRAMFGWIRSRLSVPGARPSRPKVNEEIMSDGAEDQVLCAVRREDNGDILFSLRGDDGAWANRRLNAGAAAAIVAALSPNGQTQSRPLQFAPALVLDDV